jgi:hypothetical protein
MTKTLFVCYHHGCRGEGLTYKISQHSFFKTLEADIVNNRTIIKNDYCNKQLLNSWIPNWSSIKLPTDINIVVPSHFRYNKLKKHFPEAYFVSIDIPKDIETFRQKLYDRYYTYKTKNILELAGECENRIREYNPKASVEDVKKFTVKIFKIKDITFGDIRCYAKNLEPTVENKKMLLNKYTMDPLSDETKQNSFVIPYEEVQEVDVEEIINYIK